MAGTDSYKERPDEVWFVERIPSPTEYVPYYGRKLRRMYQSKAGVKTFINAHKHKASVFKVYTGKVNWTEVKLEEL